MRYLVTLILFVMGSPVWSAASVDITDPSQTAALAAIQHKIDNVSSAVMACIDSGQDHPSCLCQNQPLIADFNASVTALFKAYPNLAKQDLVQFKAENGLWVTQSLSTIQQQVRTPPPCH
ncbi:MAG: hypothetical protein V7707_01195 [Motiliproteus sp.]